MLFRKEESLTSISEFLKSSEERLRRGAERRLCEFRRSPSETSQARLFNAISTYSKRHTVSSFCDYIADAMVRLRTTVSGQAGARRVIEAAVLGNLPNSLDGELWVRVAWALNDEVSDIPFDKVENSWSEFKAGVVNKALELGISIEQIGVTCAACYRDWLREYAESKCAPLQEEMRAQSMTGEPPYEVLQQLNVALTNLESGVCDDQEEFLAGLENRIIQRSLPYWPLLRQTIRALR